MSRYWSSAQTVRPSAVPEEHGERELTGPAAASSGGRVLGVGHLIFTWALSCQLSCAGSRWRVKECLGLSDDARTKTRGYAVMTSYK